MNEKYSCVVDAQGHYVDFVLQLLMDQEDGTEEWVVQHYRLKEGETLVDSPRPPALRQHAGADGFIVPAWDKDTTAWVEGATAEEIAAWELEHPAPEVQPPSKDEQLRADVDYLAVMTGVAL